MEPQVRDTEIVIVGTGFSGLGMAIRLKQEGVEDFVVLERGDEVGGTWHFNTYPGCGCDVPSHLYSFSFAPNPDWTRTYSRQPEIHDYLVGLADRYALRPHIRFGCTVQTGTWDDEVRRWTVETDRGTLRARVLIAGMGPLAEPKVPDLPGLDSFTGHTMHSARWDHDYDLRGKRVASIGTGASAIQYVPSIQPEVERLHVFQRTAPWILPHTDRPTSDFERRLYRRFPAFQRVVRGGVWAGRETNVLGFVKNPKLMGGIERLARWHIRRQVADPALRVQVTPDYTIGCKRILPSNRWYPALGRPNVELVPGAVKEIRGSAVVGADGVEREVDAIIFGTGFQVTDMPAGKALRGRDGKTLDDVWRGSPRAHLGTSIAGFPNLFMLLGPNTGLGHSSMIYMIESQIAHVADALRAMRSSSSETVEVRAAAAERYNDAIERKMERTVWSTGCSSWYLDDTGRNATLWPDWTFRFRNRTAHFDAAEYELRAADREPVAA